MDTEVLFPPPQTPSPGLTRTPTVNLNASRTITVPNTRQKSCDACVHGKRGCDKKQPQCSRCVARKIPCVYRRRRLPRVTADSAPDSVVSSEPDSEPSQSASLTTDVFEGEKEDGQEDTDADNILVLPMHDSRSSIFSSVIDIDLDLDVDPSAFGSQELSLISRRTSNQSSSMSSFTASTPSSSSSPSSSSPSSSSSSSTPHQQSLPSPDLGFDEAMLDYSILDMMPGLGDTPSDSDLWLAQCHDFPDLPALEAQRRMLETELPPECITEQVVSCPGNEFVQPWEIKDPSTKIGYMVQQIQHVPSKFAQTRTTPFISHRLYRNRQPRAITHAWTACTVYNARTPATETWAMRVVVEGAAAVLRSPPPLVADDHNLTNIDGSINANSVLDRLSCVHALLLYQIIRLFDGDVMLATQVERDMPTFLSWIDQLVIVRDRMEEEMLGGLVMNGMNGQSIKQKAPKTWDDWILMESVRRTVIKSYCVVALFECLRNRTRMFLPATYMRLMRIANFLSQHLVKFSTPLIPLPYPDTSGRPIHRPTFSWRGITSPSTASFPCTLPSFSSMPGRKTLTSLDRCS
jgi:hypothetical protein